MSTAAHLSVIVDSNISGVTRGFQAVDKQINAFGARSVAVGNLVANAVMGIGSRAVGAISSTVGAAADFEKTLSGIKAVSGATADEMKGISGLALQLGADTAYSASAAAQGIEELLKGGLTLPDVMNGAAEAMLNLAAAGDVAIPDAAAIAANAMGIFSLKGEEMAHVSDMIAGAANASSLSVTDFKFSMSAAGAVAAGVGQSFDDLAVAIAVAGKNGLKGSDMGTSLKSLLLNLQPTTKAATRQFKDLGLISLDTGKLMQAFASQGLNPALAKMEDAEEILKKQITGWDGVKKMTTEQQEAWSKAATKLGVYNNAFINTDGSFKSMAEIAGVLQEKTKGLTDAQRAQALETMFGSDAIRMANVFVKEGAAGFTNMAAAMGQVTAESVAAERLNNFAGAVEQMNGSLDTLRIVLGLQVLPLLTMLLNSYITPGINAVSSFAQAVFAAADPFAYLVSQVDALLPGFATFVGFVQGNLGPILAGVGAIIAAAVVPALISFASAALALAPTLLPILAIGVAAAVAYKAFSENWYGIATIVSAVVASLAPVFNSIVALVQSVAAAFSEGGLGAAFVALVAGLPAVGTALSTWAANAGAILLSLGQQFIGWIAPMIPQALAALASYATAVYSWIVTQAPLIASQMLTWGEGFIGWITPYISLALTALTTFATSIYTWIVAQAPVFMTQLMTWGNALASWVSPYIPVVLSALGGLAASLWGWITAQAAPIATKLQTWASAFLQWIGPATVDFLNRWPAMLSSFLDWIGGAAGPILAKLGDWALSFVAWILPMIPDLLVGLGAIALAVGAWIVETAGVIGTKFVTEVVPAFINWIQESAVPKLAPALSVFWDELSGWISTAAGWVKEKAIELGTALVEGAWAGIDKMGSWFTGKLEGFANSAVNAAKAALGIHSPSRVMAAEVGAPMAQGVAVGYAKESKTTGKTLQDATLDLVSKVADAVQKGLSAFKSLSGDIPTVSLDSINTFAENITRVIGVLVATASRFKTKGVEAAATWAEASGKILGIISTGASALAALRTHASVTRDQVMLFATDLYSVITTLVDIVRTWDKQGTESAAEWASSAKTILDIFGVAADGMARLRDHAGVTRDEVLLFGLDLIGVVETLAVIVKNWDKKATENAALWATSAKTILEIIGVAADGISKIRDYSAVTRDAVLLFGLDLIGVVETLAVIVKNWDKKATESAAAWASSAKTILGIVSDAAAAIESISDYGGVTRNAVLRFGRDVFTTIAILADIVATWDEKATKAAAEWAAVSKAIIDLIAPAIQALSALPDYAGVTRDAVLLFGNDLFSVITTLALIVATWDQKATKAAAAFASVSGVIIDLISKGVEALSSMRRYASVPQKAILSLAADLRLVIEAMITELGRVAKDAAKPAAETADLIGRILAPISTALSTFKDLKDYKPTDAAAMGQIAADMHRMVWWMIEVAKGLSEDGVKAAAEWAVSADLILKPISSALSAFKELREYKPTDGKAMGQLAADIHRMIWWIEQIAKGVTNEGLQAALDTAEAINTIFSTLSSAIGSLKDIGEAGKGGSFAGGITAVFTAIGAGLTLLQAQMATQVPTLVALLVNAWPIVVLSTDEAFTAIFTLIHDRMAAAWNYVVSVVDLIQRSIKSTMNQIDSLINKINSIPTVPSGGGPPAGTSGLQMRAMGGPVMSNRPYIVGERGPELFTPGCSGGITSNSDLKGMGSSEGGSGMSLTIANIDLRGSSLSPDEVEDRIHDAVSRAFEQASKSTVNKARQRGMRLT